ncbi:hypothetical protein AOLI_G00271000 [Acnodon oligacanthus]
MTHRDVRAGLAHLLAAAVTAVTAHRPSQQHPLLRVHPAAQGRRRWTGSRDHAGALLKQERWDSNPPRVGEEPRRAPRSPLPAPRSPLRECAGLEQISCSSGLAFTFYSSTELLNLCFNILQLIQITVLLQCQSYL